MNKNIAVLLIVVVALGGFFFFMNNEVAAPTPILTPEPAPAETDTATEGSDYVGMTVVEAESAAGANSTILRVVKIDGEPQMVTEDYRIGRINAVVADGVVISYSIEGENVAEKPVVEKTDGHTNPYFTDNDMHGDMMTVQNPPEDTNPNNHDEIIGMTTTSAKEYANTNEVDYRIGKVDGEAQMVTSDFRPGRITASIEKGVVVGYTVE